MFTALLLLGIFNGLVFLPVLLIMVGPPAEVIPSGNGDSLAPPSPEVATSRKSGSAKATFREPTASPFKIGNLNPVKKHHSDLSLSTIAEESGSYASNSNHYSTTDLRSVGGGQQQPPLTSQSLNGASVFVEPHVVVETTTYPHVSIFVS